MQIRRPSWLPVHVIQAISIVTVHYWVGTHRKWCPILFLTPGIWKSLFHNRSPHFLIQQQMSTAWLHSNPLSPVLPISYTHSALTPLTLLLFCQTHLLMHMHVFECMKKKKVTLLPESQANVLDESSKKIMATACFFASRGILVMFLMLWSSVIWGGRRQRHVTSDEAAEPRRPTCNRSKRFCT